MFKDPYAHIYFLDDEQKHSIFQKIKGKEINLADGKTKPFLIKDGGDFKIVELDQYQIEEIFSKFDVLDLDLSICDEDLPF